MFAYCLNNPVNRTELLGYMSYDAVGEDPNNDDSPLNDTARIGNGVEQNVGYKPGRGFSSFRSLKKFLGSPGENNHWHHIVEQSQKVRSDFTSEQINNTSNVVALNGTVHQKISALYSSIMPYSEGVRVRDWLAGKSFEFQYQFGMDQLQLLVFGGE